MSGLSGAPGRWPACRGRLAHGPASENALETTQRSRVPCGARAAPQRAGEPPALVCRAWHTASPSLVGAGWQTSWSESEAGW